MIRFKIKALMLASALVWVGCSETATYVSQNDKKTKRYVTGGLDFEDVQDSAKRAVNSMLADESVKALMAKGKRVVAVSDVINDTTEHFDVQQLTNLVLQDLKKGSNNRFYVTRSVSGTGGMTDSMIEKSRALRNNADFDQDTTISKGHLKAPELSLMGKVTQRNARVSATKQKVVFVFSLELVDLKSGLQVWSDTYDIAKITSNRNVSF
ncbi:penicillin-binding protein activator LpoB [Helicobacter cetorum]|uniref:penicillin-binding protein activator LpoB n=1 Tax=Helicobacter cetorum TaxID=138563 RepID=UPI000CF0D2B8|nr:penicillin-binding protein activator LpoB [Helicobacter cetorum]